MPELKKVQSTAFCIAIIIAFGFCVWFLLSGFGDNAQPNVELQNRINPNDAPAASLARLPGIGIIKANAIVEYRQQFQKSGRGDLAFKDCNDLRNIKGIGPKTTENMCEYLRFE